MSTITAAFTQKWRGKTVKKGKPFPGATKEQLERLLASGQAVETKSSTKKSQK